MKYQSKARRCYWIKSLMSQLAVCTLKPHSWRVICPYQLIACNLWNKLSLLYTLIQCHLFLIYLLFILTCLYHFTSCNSHISIFRITFYTYQFCTPSPNDRIILYHSTTSDYYWSPTPFYDIFTLSVFSFRPFFPIIYTHCFFNKITFPSEVDKNSETLFNTIVSVLECSSRTCPIHRSAGLPPSASFTEKDVHAGHNRGQYLLYKHPFPYAHHA